MKEFSYNIQLHFDQILSLVKQLSDTDRNRLLEEISQVEPRADDELDEEKIKDIMRHVKPYFNEKLGKFTHKKKSEDWYFYGLGFSRNDMGYCFGFNIGFFQKGTKNSYNKLGMNVLITTNKENSPIRQQYLSFFKNALKGWVNQEEKSFAYPERGDEGVELAFYDDFEKFDSEEEIINFFKKTIDGIHKIYKQIVENPDVFDKVVRAAPKWNDYILEICQSHIQ